jgi:hypothetical protein
MLKLLHSSNSVSSAEPKKQKNEFLTIGSQTSKNSSTMTTVEICKLLGLSHKGTKAERIERINAHAGDPQPPSEDRCTAIIATPVQLEMLVTP